MRTTAKLAPSDFVLKLGEHMLAAIGCSCRIISSSPILLRKRATSLLASLSRPCTTKTFRETERTGLAAESAVGPCSSLSIRNLMFKDTDRLLQQGDRLFFTLGQIFAGFLRIQRVAIDPGPPPSASPVRAWWGPLSSERRELIEGLRAFAKRLSQRLLDASFQRHNFRYSVSLLGVLRIKLLKATNALLQLRYSSALLFNSQVWTFWWRRDLTPGHAKHLDGIRNRRQRPCRKHYCSRLDCSTAHYRPYDP